MENTKELSYDEKILCWMIRQKNFQSWFMAADFQRSDMPRKYFIGYEAGTKIAVMNRKYPALFEKRRSGKYIERKLNFFELDRISGELPESTQTELRRHIIQYDANRTIMPKQETMQLV